MGKDFRPVDLYLADKLLAESNSSLRNMVSSLRSIVIPDTSNEKIHLELQNPDAKSHYPELTFLFADFSNIYSTYCQYKTAIAVFREFENALKKCESNIRKNQKSVHHLYRQTNEAFFCTPIEDVVSEWFYGNLDSNFYYCEENNYQFSEYMRHKIESAVMEDLRKGVRNGSGIQRTSKDS